MSEKPSETEDLEIDGSVERISHTLDEIIRLFTEVSRAMSEMTAAIEETLKKIAPQEVSGFEKEDERNQRIERARVRLHEISTWPGDSV